MSTKQRGPSQATSPKHVKVVDASDQDSELLFKLSKQQKDVVSNDWDYKLALAVITLLAFATRFYGITHPNQVVFDEVHFGKVSHLYVVLEPS